MSHSVRIVFSLISLLLVTTLAPVYGQVESKRLPYAIVGYCWTDVKPDCDNLISFGTRRLTLDNLNDPAGMKAITDKMPEGHRVIFIWDLERDITRHPDDRCKTADGQFTPYQGVWLDNGTERLRQRVDTFFKKYQELGGKLDVLVLDYEGGLGLWHIGNGAKDAVKWQAIQADPRFPDLAKELGFTDLTTVVEYYKQKGDTYNNYLRWGSLMEERMAGYINKSIYEPVKQYFPKVQFSNYGNAYYTKDLGVPDCNGHRGYLFGKGSQVGTHQSYELYSRLGQIKNRPPDGVTTYAHTPFNGFRYSLNVMRGMAGSSDAPIHPWIAHRDFKEAYDYTGITKHDLYQEMIFHAGVCGADDFIFWNPHPWRPDQSPEGFTNDTQDKLFSDCLKQLDKLIGFADRKTLSKTLVPWDADFALSGINAGGRTVWRFTPNLDAGGKREDTLVAASPATFKVGDKLIIIPGGKVYTPEIELSAQGYWVVGPAQADTMPVVVKK